MPLCELCGVMVEDDERGTAKFGQLRFGGSKTRVSKTTRTSISDSFHIGFPHQVARGSGEDGNSPDRNNAFHGPDRVDRAVGSSRPRSS